MSVLSFMLSFLRTKLRDCCERDTLITLADVYGSSIVVVISSE